MFYPHAPVRVALAMVAFAALVLGGAPDAHAQSFDGYACPVCPTMTEVEYSYSPYNELPWDPNCSSGTCPNYINNLHHRREFVTNRWVAQVDFWLEYFFTEVGYDYLDTRIAGVSTPYYHMTGTPAIGWYPITGWRPQATPIDFVFHTDSSVTSSGFHISKARACCTTTASAPLGRALIPNARTTGILMASGDNVNFYVPTAGSGSRSNIATWGTAGKDFDVYVRCNAMPTKDVWDYRGYSASVQEFLSFANPGLCTNPGTWYIVVNSFAGAGQFNLVYSVMYDAQYRNVRAGIAYAATSQERTTFGDTLQRAARQFYGQTEGRIVLAQFDIWNNVGTNCAGSCGGQPCDICFVNTPGTAFYVPSDNRVYVYQGYFSDYEGVAHEVGHMYLGVLDEYINGGGNVPGGYWGCGHSNMANPRGTQNNFCMGPHTGTLYYSSTLQDHEMDRTPGSPSTGVSSVWTVAAAKVPAAMEDTPDNYDYQDHYFGGRMNVIQH